MSTSRSVKRRHICISFDLYSIGLKRMSEKMVDIFLIVSLVLVDPMKYRYSKMKRHVIKWAGSC